MVFFPDLSGTAAECMDVFKHFSGAMSQHLTPCRIMLSICSKPVDSNHKDTTLTIRNRVGRISMGGSSTITGAPLSRRSRPPRYQLRTHNTPVRKTNSLRKLWGNQKKRLHEFSSTIKWIQARFSIHCFNCDTLFPLSIIGLTIGKLQRSLL